MKKVLILVCLIGLIFAIVFCKNSILGNLVASSDNVPEISGRQVREQFEVADEIVKNQKSRVKDIYGSGQFGASRDGGTRKHKGIDIVVNLGEKIYCPIVGTIMRQIVAYKNDNTYKGIEIIGNEVWDGYKIKILYVDGLFSGNANKSQEIGFAQDLTIKYPGITNHIHIEAYYKGKLIDPFELWQYSF